MLVRYEGGDRGIEVDVWGDYKRGDIAAPVMSTSSGPKAYLKNIVYYAFEGNPAIERIRLCVGRHRESVPFALFRREGCWRDCTGRIVECGGKL
jgi:hypothetical protein